MDRCRARKPQEHDKIMRIDMTRKFPSGVLRLGLFVELAGSRRMLGVAAKDT